MEERADEGTDGVVAGELRRLRLLKQQGHGLDKQEELERAICGGCLEVVRYLVEECRANVYTEANSGWTALMWAARRGRVDVVSYLVEESSANVNIQDKDGRTALMWAVIKGNTDVARYLGKESSVDVNVQDKDGWTALMMTAKYGCVDIVRNLVEECNADVNVQANDRCTVLLRAAMHGQVGIVRYLVGECIADINILRNTGWTALLMAARYGHVDIVRYLVGECSADVNIQCNTGWTALMMAARYGHVDIVRNLVGECSADVNIQDNSGWTALLMAVRHGNAGIVRYLVEESSADVNIQDNSGLTALYVAARCGHVDIVRYLVKECTANVNIQINTNAFVLIWAASAGHVDIVRNLVEKCSVTVKIQNNKGLTALMMAAKYGHVDIVRYLVEECNADVNIQANDRRTALTMAASDGHMDVVRYLVKECSANVNVQDNKGQTALLMAASGGHVDVVRYLVEECSADVDIQSNTGWTVLRRAAKDGHVDIVRYLVERCSADVKIQDNDGSSTLLGAVSEGDVDIVRNLVEYCSTNVNIDEEDGSTALMWAASNDHVDFVRYLVEKCSVTVNIQNNKGLTALMMAAKYGHVDIVRYLVEECDADVNVQDNKGQAALLISASGGHVDVVRYLVEECSVDVNVQDKDGWTALLMAASGGHVDVVRYLVEECSADVDIQSNTGWTVLRRAAKDGHVDIVRYLVERCSADVKIQDNDGSSTLLGAVSEGDVDIVRNLVEYCSTNVNIDEEDGSTALMWAASNDHVDFVRYLVKGCSADVNIQDNKGLTALIKAASNDHLDIVRYLVEECKADVNIQAKDRRTALMMAAKDGHMDVVRYLVEECSVDVNVQDKDGWTALMMAARYGRIDVVRYLVGECSADVNVQAKYRYTVLWSAVGYGHVDIVRYLVKECSANVSMQDNNTLMIWAARCGHVDIVRYLVEQCSADVNIQDNSGWTALMKAASGGHVDIMHYLVEECSADVNVQSNTGWTALMMAAKDGHMDVVRYLLEECSADVNIQSNTGRTALMKATRYGHVDVVRYLVERCSADVNKRDNKAQTTLRIAFDRGYNDIVRLLTSFAQPNRQSTTHSGDKLLASDASRSFEIPPAEVELGEFSEQRNIGGDFRVKWLGADAVVKLFIPDASESTFEQEVRAWQELRHPNVLKLYGVCQAAPNVNFFVCEYASQGSLAEYGIPSSSDRELLTWKFLYEAALGLEYLHERGIIHGDLRCSNILIGNDGMAKLSNFGSTDVANHSRAVIRSMRWQAPEVLEGNSPSRESDVYSLGMCILEAESGKRPWSTRDESLAKFPKSKWNADAAGVPYNKPDSNNPCGGPIFVRSDDPHFVRRSRELVWWMCCAEPDERSSLTSIISALGHLISEGNPDVPQPKSKTATCFEGYKGEGIKERWQKLHECMNESDNAEHGKLFDKLKRVCDRLQELEPSERLLDRFYSLVTDFYRTVKMTPEEAWAMQLSSTRATTSSIISFTRRINALLKALGDSVPEETDISWQQKRREQGAAFVSGITDTVLLLQNLKSVEEQAALLNSLRSEMENPDDKYTADQLQTMRKTYDVIESKLSTEGVEDAATLTPKWFIPWYELLLDEGGEALGVGGFGSVRRAKWLDSDVVVKEVLLPGSERTASYDSFYASLFATVDQRTTDPQTVAKRAEAQEMFRREADIWFGFGYPHVVRLFGACHIGRPFFVCEYATHGTLDSYLRNHPDDLWAKLHEAALGVQYLHVRGVVHGDLKGNNVVVGSDLKAKVTDFGLSLAADSEGSAPISGAWHWVAPECLVNKQGKGTSVKPTFESDVYSLGMCIVEALRVVEAVQDGKPSYGCLPWGMLDPFVVKFKVTRREMPSRPSICTDKQWNLVTRMCVFDPKKRLKISTVVDELARFVKTSTGTNTNNQVDHLTDDGAALTPPVNRESVESMTAAARKRLSQLRGSTKQQDHSPVVLYDSLWDRIEHVRGQIDEGDQEAACRSEFYSLVVDAETSTASLAASTEDLMSLTRVVMGCYALSRRLDKLCDTYFLKSPNDLAFPEA